MSRKTFCICIVVLAAALAAALWIRNGVKAEPDWDISYGMINQNVKWTGAGYNGR